VPVTGGDLDGHDRQGDLIQSILLKVGAALLGLALVLQGIGARRNRAIIRDSDRNNRSR
jgi:hypothetical protein